MTVTIHPADERTELDVVGDTVTPLISAGQFELFELAGPEGSGPPPHAHPWDEGYLILDGRVAIGSDDGEIVVDAGQRVLIEGGTTHWYRIVSETGRFLVATGGKSAGAFFADMDASVPAGHPTEETMPAIIEVAKRNGLTSPLF
jgi:quercetin dioxygenase-like cupin family protein